jgi:hypothetical protein
MNMTCDAWRGAILEHAAGDLAPHRMAAVERHLVECPACRAESAAWRLLADEAQLAVRLPAPPVARAMGKVRALAAAEASSGPLVPLTVRPGWSRKPWWPGVLAMAACAAGLFWMARSPVAPIPIAPTSPRQSADAPAVSATAADATAVGATAQSDPARGALQRVRPAGNATPAMERRPASAAMAAAPAAVAPLSPTRALQPAVSASDPPAPSPNVPIPWVDEERAAPDRRTATPWPPAQPEPSGRPPVPSEPTATSPAPATTAQPTRPGLARIAGRVEDPDGRPVFMALVYLRPAGSGEGWGVVLTDTDDRGGFAVDLPPGRWELWVEAAGQQPWHYQDEPVLDLGGQDERRGILLRLPVSPPAPSLPTASPTSPQPTGTAPAAAPISPIRIAPILPPTAPTSPLPDPIEPKEWMP